MLQLSSPTSFPPPTAALEHEGGGDGTALWQAFHAQRSEPNRNALILRYLPLAKYNAHRVAEHLPQHVDREDLLQSAIFGLKDAIGSFDPGRGVKFETYCVQRIRGAILDSIRSLLCAPRDIRRNAQRLQQADQEMQMELGRSPSQEEIAHRLGVSPNDYRELARLAVGVSLTELGGHWQHGEETSQSGLDDLPDPREEDPLRELQRQDLKDLILRKLNKTERLVLLLYYYEEMSMREIGVSLGISESRVSQIHSGVLGRLREKLGRRFAEASGRRGLSVNL